PCTGPSCTAAPSTAASSTSLRSTAAPSTAVPSTAPSAPTTTMATGNCETAGQLFILVSNHSIVIDSLYADCTTYNGTQCTLFRAYILRIDNMVVRNTALTTAAQRIHEFKYNIDQYCGNNPLRNAWVRGSPMNNGWGTVKQICDCDTL
uniref:G8 domain-containing protein n=1 Tax=Steinernema glaseri TaxID=37863 RepID=A0A1I7Z3X7_9BILA